MKNHVLPDLGNLKLMDLQPRHIIKYQNEKLENGRLMRHTHATELLQAGVNPKIVQERLGHHDVSVTLDVYSHVIPSMQKDAIKKLKNYRNKNSNAHITHINKN